MEKGHEIDDIQTYGIFHSPPPENTQIVWLGGGGGGVSLCNTCHQTLSLLCRGITNATTIDVFPSKGDKVIGTGAYRKHQAMAR